jgi:hypothetical protein
MALPHLVLLLAGLGDGINPARVSGNAEQSLKQHAAAGKDAINA